MSDFSHRFYFKCDSILYHLLPFASRTCLCEADYQTCCNINVESTVDDASDSEKSTIESASNCHAPHEHKVMFTNPPINVMFSQVL